MAAAIVLSFLATTLVIILAFPKTPAARFLHRSLVEGPVRFMHELTWKKVGQIALSTAALCFMMAIGPQMLALMLTMGLDAAFVEVLILMYAASAWERIASSVRSMQGAALKALMFVPNLILRRSRRREARRPRRPRSQAGNDDKSDPRWSFA